MIDIAKFTAEERQAATSENGPGTPDLLALLAAVKQELGDHLDRFDHDASDYAKRYLVFHTQSRRRHPPQAPPGLHPLLAKLVRETVVDTALAQRLYGSGR